MFHYKGCGLDNVWLRNGYVERKTPYGTAVAIHNMEGLHRAIGLTIVTKKPTLEGKEIRFLRKELDLSQAHLAKILGIGETSVRNWENNRVRVSRPAERMLRILYSEHVKGDGTVREHVERLSELNRENYFFERFELEETEGGWAQAA